MRKGSKVYLEGGLRTRKWQDKEGQDRYTTEIVGNEMQMLDSRGTGQDGANPVQRVPEPAGARPASHPEAPNSNIHDDDIPF